MANLNLGGANAFTNMSSGCHRSAGQYRVSAPHPSGEHRESQFNTAPGTDYRKRIDHGFRYRELGPFRVLYVDSNEAGLDTRIEADITAIHADVGSGGTTLTMPSGTTYDHCYLVSGYPKEIPFSRFKSEAGTTWYCLVDYMFEQDEE